MGGGYGWGNCSVVDLPLHCTTVDLHYEPPTGLHCTARQCSVPYAAALQPTAVHYRADVWRERPGGGVPSCSPPDANHHGSWCEKALTVGAPWFMVQVVVASFGGAGGAPGTSTSCLAD